MSKFLAAAARHAEESPANDSAASRAMATTTMNSHSLAISETLPHVTTPSETLVPPALASRKEIHRISESFAAVASISGDARLAIAGCAAGDGCSSVAAAIALDLTQRLNVRTLLVDGNICRPRVAKMFSNQRASVLKLGTRTVVELESDRGIVVHSSNWARLEVALITHLVEKNEVTSLDELNERASGFPAVVIDLGAVRLDPRALPLARPNDPVLLVVRSGYTERSDLLATVNLFSNIGRPAKGVILNATRSAIPGWVQRLLRK